MNYIWISIFHHLIGHLDKIGLFRTNPLTMPEQTQNISPHQLYSLCLDNED